MTSVQRALADYDREVDPEKRDRGRSAILRDLAEVVALTESIRASTHDTLEAARVYFNV